MSELDALIADQAEEQMFDAEGLNSMEFEDYNQGIDRVPMHPNQLDGLGCSNPENAIIDLIDNNYDIGGILS